jgi:hypothetical protein
LIGVGGIATGNVGVVGTANKGPVNEVVVLGDYGQAVEIFGSYDRWGTTNALTLTRTLEQLFKGGASTVLAVRIANGTPASRTWTIRSATDDLFTLTATSPGTWADDITLGLTAPDADGVVVVTFTQGTVKEIFRVKSAKQLVDDVNAASNFFSASGLDAGDNAEIPRAAVAGASGGPNGAAATGTNVDTGLALLETRDVNLLVIGGFTVNQISANVIAHLEKTETDGKERIAVLGAESNQLSTVLSNAASTSHRRVVLVAPGIKSADAARRSEADPTVTLTPDYAAALVAGKLASLPPHISLTNQEIGASLAREYNRAELKQLVQSRVLALQKNLGIRVLKGISTSTKPWDQISVRRIVDYAKAGVRLGSNPYIGRLNNARVRAALKATLDGFLSRMVVDEMLTEYELKVSATRQQEINGEAIVTMTLKPTFSIDVIKVIMNLQ